MRSSSMAIVAVLVAIFLMASCVESSFVGTWEADDMEFDITNDSPYRVRIEVDGEIHYFTEFDDGVADDGTFDWVILDNPEGIVIGLRMPRDTYDYVEFVVFDYSGDIEAEAVFQRK
jgi:hypothetical protein